MAFLTTRVTKSTEFDWLKLKRLLKWLNYTINDVRIMGSNDDGVLLTWIDAAYEVHEDMRSQLGGVVSMGHGVVNGKSMKQRLNSKSSTEAEVIGTSDLLPYSIWEANFLKCQGYELKENVLFQDNMSAIKMEKNGRQSCTGNSRHINIRYFFAKDRVDKDEINIRHCPTGKMLADYFTKPLQGKLFGVFCDVIMGRRPLSWLEKNYPSTKERVIAKNIAAGSEGKTAVNNFDKTRISTYAETVMKGSDFESVV